MVNKKVLIGVIIIAVVVIAGYFVLSQKTNNLNTTEGQRCGGNIQNAPTCCSGYHCAPVSGSNLPFGDVGGTCVKN